MTGKEVRETLLSNGITLAELASRLGVSAQTFNSRLNAKHFKDEYLDEITQHTGISFGSERSLEADSLLRIIESQQKTIETLSRTIESLLNK